MIKLAIVSPCFNEQVVLPQSIIRLLSLLDHSVNSKRISADSYIILVDDGSVDATWSVIQDANKKDNRVKAIRLLQNYGHQKALYAGMMDAKGHVDAVITIDVDLQDNLESVEDMLNCVEAGYDIVCGVKSDRSSDRVDKRLLARCYYYLLQPL